MPAEYPQFRRRSDADVRIASARRAMTTVLSAEEVLPVHRRELLTICLWKITEAEGTSKYRTRFRSLASLSAPSSELQHEHVYQRRKLVDRLMNDPASIDDVIATAVGCTVTKSEHRKLTQLSREDRDLDGWQRYIGAGIVVVDCATGERGVERRIGTS